MPTAAAESGPPAKRPRTGGPSSDANPAKGTIARVRLHNFMTHRDAEIVDPGTRLNCIVGPNGTGKSSIVCAMCVGLGGPLKITGRGDQIKACVMGEGKTPDENGQPIRAGFVETELVDGSGPGRNLTVRLDFDVDNKEKWQMDGKPCKKGDVKEAMARLNIQVDNPLQFLPQDKVGEFSNMSPVKLLEHTEMAIGPQTYEKHKRLIDDDKELATVKTRLATERKSLDDLETVNKTLEQDVARFRALQENKKKLDAFRGKVLWVEADVVRERADNAKTVLGAKEAELKDIKNEVKKRESACKPLEEARDKHEKQLRSVNGKNREADDQRMRSQQPLQKLMDEQEEVVGKMNSLDKQREKKLKKVEEAQLFVDEGERKVASQEEQLAAQSGRDPEDVKAELTAKVADASAAARQAQDAQREHASREAGLQREHQQADKALTDIEDAKKRKMRLVVDKNRDAAQAAYWLDNSAPPQVKEQVIGPLIMHIDVPDKAHQPLIEEAIGPKHAFSGFLAMNDEVRNVVTRHVSEQSWKLNVYKNDGAGGYRPRQRPASSTMHKWGVTKWLDEALQIADQYRDAILTALKDLMQLDLFLLATPKTMGCIEQLQQYLNEQKMEMVTVLTPNRVYRVMRSRYGARMLNATTAVPKAPQGLYNNSSDERQKEALLQERDRKQAALREHRDLQTRLAADLENATADKAAAQTALSNFNQGRGNLRTLQQRLEHFRKRLADAHKDAADFDVSAQREKLQKKLVELASREAAEYAKIAEVTTRIVELRQQEIAASLAHKAAKHALKEASEAVVELTTSLGEKKSERDEAAAGAQQMAQEHAAKAAQARRAAPHFELDKHGKRQAAAQAQWDGMPSDLDKLSDEIAELEEEINSSDDDGGQTLRDYEARLKDIEAGKGKVQATDNEVASKQTALDELTAEWKPELERLVRVVNDNFADYFRRFRCSGEVALADGRKLNPQTGEPEGPDDFSQYKMLIKVQWRNTEDLHVLGEGGRDSGGERSVATMVYLISLQNINPAPFRVVDEINQAMDSTNERNVFECITHACREGGKQYFLLTPKLLPDLDYGEETTIQLVLNGPYNLPNSQFALADWA